MQYPFSIYILQYNLSGPFWCFLMFRPACHPGITMFSPACHPWMKMLSPACRPWMKMFSPACHPWMKMLLSACHPWLKIFSPACYPGMKMFSPACHPCMKMFSPACHPAWKCFSLYATLYLTAHTYYLMSVVTKLTDSILLYFPAKNNQFKRAKNRKFCTVYVYV